MPSNDRLAEVGIAPPGMRPITTVKTFRPRWSASQSGRAGGPRGVQASRFTVCCPSPVDPAPVDGEDLARHERAVVAC